MKKLILILMMLAVFNASAQEFTLKPKGKISEITVVVQNLFSDLVIEGSRSGEIRIMADDYEGIPEKAEGLRPLSALGPDNSGIGLNINQNGNIVTISGTYRRNDDTDYTIYLPADIKLRIDYGSFKSDDITIKGMTNEVEVKSQVGDLMFKDVTGPIVASTLSADIEIEFSDLSQSSPTSITSISGDIDISIPKSSKADFTLSSTSGEIYTDLDLEITGNKGMRRWGGFVANATLNGGGVEVTIKSISGDVFIRKGD